MQARFEQIKWSILQQIEQGKLTPGDKVASENSLAEQFGVSRMTARRALSELVDQGFLIRSQGLGTFVSDTRPMSSILTIRSIHAEIKERGHEHSSQIIALNCIAATPQMSMWMDVLAGSELYRSQIIHYDNKRAIQFEDRLVNPVYAPDYLQQDFAQRTPSEYLNVVAPLTEADHIVEACLPSTDIAQKLDIDEQQAVLKINRRTYSRAGVVSYALLYHPGNRYRLGGHLNF